MSKNRIFAVTVPFPGALPDKSDVPACPTCKTTRFVAALIDEATAIYAGVTCENGHSHPPNKLIRITVAEASVAAMSLTISTSTIIQAWLNEYSIELNGSTDRAAAIIATSMLDTVLFHLVSAFVIDEPHKAKEYLQRRLRSFDSKIEFAYFVGLISEAERRALHVLRSIRNEFAHRLENLTFANTSLQSKVTSMATALQVQPNDELVSRSVFEVCVRVLWSKLLTKLSLVHHRAKMPLEPIEGILLLPKVGS